MYLLLVDVVALNSLLGGLETQANALIVSHGSLQQKNRQQ